MNNKTKDIIEKIKILEAEKVKSRDNIIWQSNSASCVCIGLC